MASHLLIFSGYHHHLSQRILHLSHASFKMCFISLSHRGKVYAAPETTSSPQSNGNMASISSPRQDILHHVTHHGLQSADQVHVNIVDDPYFSETQPDVYDIAPIPLPLSLHESILKPNTKMSSLIPASNLPSTVSSPAPVFDNYLNSPDRVHRCTGDSSHSGHIRIENEAEIGECPPTSSPTEDIADINPNIVINGYVGQHAKSSSIHVRMDGQHGMPNNGSAIDVTGNSWHCPQQRSVHSVKGNGSSINIPTNTKTLNRTTSLAELDLDPNPVCRNKKRFSEAFDAGNSAGKIEGLISSPPRKAFSECSTKMKY